ncbi:MAG: serine/threonine protein phosphatase [Clostridia bacterium]|nr:serine/threonine protein phosphatase [Clostridia bacterium]
MIYVSSDLHGYSLEKFQRLLDKAGFGEDDYLFILGDVIDRGSDGIKILRWMMLQPNVQLIRGNHEDMLLGCDFLFGEVTDESIANLSALELNKYYHWKRNGANPTIEAMRALSPEERADIIDYLREAPLYDAVSIGSRNFVLVHAGLGGFERTKPLSEYSDFDLLWTRPSLSDIYSFDFITVFGHTPTVHYSKHYMGRMIKTATWINIDTGASSGLSPMLLRLDDLREFYID